MEIHETNFFQHRELKFKIFKFFSNFSNKKKKKFSKILNQLSHLIENNWKIQQFPDN